MTRQPGPGRTPDPDEAEVFPEPAPDAVGGALDVIDRSIGMYVLRRLTGRRTKVPEEPAAPVVLSADQVAYRIGAVGAAKASTSDPADTQHAATPLVAGTVAGAAASARAATTGRAGPVGTAVTRPATAAPRERLVRDSGIALLVLAMIGLVAIVFWPHGPTGQPEQSVFGANRTVVTPGPTGEVDAATGEPSASGPGEPGTVTTTSEATSPIVSRATAAAGAPTPKLPPGATPRPTSKLAPTPRPTVTAPTPTPTTGPTPTPIETPTPTPTPVDTPTPTPPETPTPTPPETPTPTPPDPTP